MKALTYREIHLDFHTGEHIPNVGANYSDENFEEILKLGKIDSINLFAKCHHGMFYYYDSKYAVHPNLKVDLLPRQIAVCEKLGVDYAVYISAGLDEYNAKKHPEWLCRDQDGRTEWTSDHLKAGYRLLCFNSPYLKELKAQTTEVIKKFPNAKEYFFDITDERICYCKYCMADYMKQGIDVNDFSAVKNHAAKVYKRYYTQINNLVKKLNPEARVYHNMGNVVRDRRDFLHSNTHCEIESLPTGSWGYDHFPLSASYVRRTGLDYVGHTGKFHTMWGDFGGFKHPNALIYETSLHVAFGAKSLVGDQLHPDGKFDRYTYECVGKAFERVEKLEPWLKGVEAVADVGILSQDCIERSFCPEGDSAANRIMLQGKYLFDLLDSDSDFSRYKVIVLPDTITLEKSKILIKLQAFVKGGGKLLASGVSATKDGKFMFDLGAKMVGEDEYNPTFMQSRIPLKNVNGVCAAMYEGAYLVEATGEVLADKYEPYFNRSVFKFCSHLYTPHDPNNATAGVTEGKDGIYVAWNIFRDFARHGAIWMKELVIALLDKLLGDNKSLQTSLPANGVITLQEQKAENRFVTHVLYVSPVLRGSVQVIEDIVPVYNVKVSIKTDKKIKKCYLAPTGEEIAFTQNGDKLEYTVPEVYCSAVVVSEY